MTLTELEFSVLDWLAEHLRCGLMDGLMPLITRLGDGGYFWITLLILLMIPKKTRKLGAAMAVALLINVVLCNLTLKPLVARPRPFDLREVALLIPPPEDFSFPSGHTSSSFAAAGALLFMKAEKELWIPSACLAVLIAFSRLYLYVHFPTDVLGGILLGLFSAFVGVRTVKCLCRLLEEKSQRRA